MTSLIRSRLLADLADLGHGFSTRLPPGAPDVTPALGADFDVGTYDVDRAIATARRATLLEACDLGRSRLVTVGQVHEDRVLVLDRGQALPDNPLHGYDAAATDRPGVALGIVTADCLPILVVDPRHRVVGTAHAGWRGTARGIALALVDSLVARFGSRPSELVAALGPCIGVCCFEVGEEVVEAIAALSERCPRLAREPDRWLDRDRGTRPHVDLVEVNRNLLARAGLSRKAIDVETAVCTHCDDRRFFSYRRDGSPTGRMLSVIGFRSPEP